MADQSGFPSTIQDHVSMFASKDWQGIDAKGLRQAALVPTMLNIEEQAFYLWLTREWFQGCGAVVDLGSFAGGSAACLAEGFKQAEKSEIVHAYDKFEVGKYRALTKRHARYLARPPASECGLSPRPLPEFSGTDLLPLAQFFLEPWGGQIKLHKGRIEELGWHGGDIELLVMDASKTAETMDLMSRQFFPHLIPGKSVVVQQDFLWWQQPWIAAQMALLQPYFEPVAYIPKHSVSFLCTKAVPVDVLKDLNVAEFGDREMIQALRDMKQRLKGFPLDRYMRRLIEAVKANPEKRKAFQFTTKP